MNRKQNVLASVLLEGGRLDIPRGADRKGGGVSLSHGKCSVNGLDIGFQLGVEHVISLGWGNKINVILDVHNRMGFVEKTCLASFDRFDNKFFFFNKAYFTSNKFEP